MSLRKSRVSLQTDIKKVSVQYFNTLIPELTKPSRYEKRKKQILHYVAIFEQYLKLLLGNENCDDLLLNTNKNLWINEKNQASSNFPEAVLSFPNPDMIPDEYEPLRQLDILETIINSFNFHEKSMHDQIFLRALESAFQTLQDRKAYTLFDLKTRHYDQTQQQKYDQPIFGTQNQLLQKTAQKTPQCVIEQNNSIERLDYYKKENPQQQIVKQFKKELMKLLQNNCSMNVIEDFIHTNCQKIINQQRKSFSQGEFLKRRNGQWVRTQNDTADLLTLIRNCIVIQLARNGFQCKQFISNDGQKIYVMLYLSEVNLQIAAENFGLYKKLSFCFTDILSLEPVDKQYRPFRLNGRLWKSEEYKNSPYLEYLKPLIIQQIKEINFKKLAREIGQSGINTELFEYGKQDLYGDQDGPTDEEWTAYYKYLVHINKYLKQMRKDEKIPNDLALIINKQQTCEKVYKLRKKIRNAKRNSIILEDLNETDLGNIDDLQKQAEELVHDEEELNQLIGLPKLKSIKVLKKQSLAHNYQVIFKEALKVANCQYQQILKNIWDRMQIQPYELYYQYQLTVKKNSVKNIGLQHLRWCKYIKNEEQQVTLFPASERLKLTNQYVQTIFNFQTLKDLKLIDQFFCPHDYYELFGHCKNIQQAVQKVSQYYKKKPFDLSNEWFINFQQPWQQPLERITMYFGEKVGLYFEFSQYFIKYASPMAALGIIFSIMLFSIGNFQDQTYITIMSLFSFLIIHWNSFQTEYWNIIQINFNLKYGQHYNQKQEQIRTQFQGSYARSIATDKLNTITIDNFVQNQKLMISIIVLLFLIFSVMGIIIGLYYFNLFLIDYLQNPTDFQLEIVITASLNYFIQTLLDLLYEKVVVLLTDFVNCQTTQEYETRFVLKKYILYCFSYVVPLLVINFLNIPLGLYCSNQNCQQHVLYYFATTTLWMFIFQCIKFLKIFFHYKVKRPIKQYEYQEQSLNSFIEDQSQRESFQKSAERYGMLEEYLQFFIFLTMVNLFGYIFPFGITLVWLWTILQVQIRKFQFLYILQRPWPKGESSLGIWTDFSQIVNLCSILCNTGMITIYYYQYVEHQIITLFLSLLFFNFIIKFLIYSMFGTTPIEINSLIQRSKYIFHSHMQKRGNFQGNSTKKEEIQRLPLFKVFGTEYEKDVGQFETISSDDEIQDHFKVNKKVLSRRMSLQNDIEIQNNISNPMCEFDYEFLHKYFLKRTYNWAYQVNLRNKEPKHEKKIRLQIYRLFFKLTLLNHYRMLWQDYRLCLNHCYIPRKQKILHNLDIRKYKIYLQSYKEQLSHYNDKAAIIFRKQFQQFGNTLTQDEINEYNILLYKYNNYIDKRSWLNTRKVVALKFKGFFFGGFRKQTIRKSSYEYAIDYYRTLQKFANAQFESGLHKQFNQHVQYSSLTTYTLDGYVELFNHLEYEPKQQYFITSANKNVNQRFYHLEALKSQTYKNVIDKARDTFIFETQSQKVEQFIQQYFLDELIQIPQIKLLRHLHDILWTVRMEDNQEYLMQFFQLKHGQSIQFQKYQNYDLGVYLGESKNYIKLPTIIDQIDDFFIKGYCVSLYKGRNCKTLYQVLQFRKKYEIHYTNDELKKFLYSNLILLSRHEIKKISIYNYVLIENEYMILNSPEENNNSLIQLIQVIVEMILLEQQDDLMKVIKDLNHPLKYFLQELIYDDKTPQQALEMMMDQTKFQEIDFQSARVSKEMTTQIYIERMKHQINFHLRIKQFQKALILVKECEDYIRINIYNVQENLLSYFTNWFSKNLMKYVLRSNEIKRILDLLLIYYFKMCILFGLKQEFQNDAQLLIDSIKRCLIQIKVMFRQLTLNVKLENLSEIDQCVILKRKLNQNLQKQSSITSFERLNLINTLRQNQDYIQVIIQYQTQLQRYQNQFQVILAIDNYFNQNYILTSIQLNDVIISQEHLVIREPSPVILNAPLDHSPGLINLDQESPTEEEEKAKYEQIQSKNFEDGDKLYFAQLLFYKFLYLLNLHDIKNETFQFYYKEFQNFKSCNENLYNFYNFQLKVLYQDKLNGNEFEKEQLCDIGKYQFIYHQKWLEIKYHKQSILQKSDDIDFQITQILILSEIHPNLDNRQIIKNLIKMNSNINTTVHIMYQMRLIHQLLHLDNYTPISHNVQLTQWHPLHEQKNKQKDSYILTLQKYHALLSFQKDTWFHHIGLSQTQMYYYLSVCFAFSPKHLENINEEIPEIVDQVLNRIKMFQGNPKFYAQILKCTQINNKLATSFLFDADLPIYQKYQIFYQYFNCSLKAKNSLLYSYNQISGNIPDEYGSSVLIICLISIFLQFQQYEMVELMLQFSDRLFTQRAQLFQNVHIGFLQDLRVLEAMYKNNTELIPIPQRYLYVYQEELQYFNDLKFSAQYLLFNVMMHQDYNYVLDIIQETIQQLKEQPKLIRFLHLFQQYFLVVNAMIGIFDIKEQQQNVSLYNYKEGSLIYALLCHFLCKYYLNILDFQTALIYSEKVLRFINTNQKKEGIILSIQNNYIKSDYQINEMLKEFQLQDYEVLVDEEQDSDYVHLINEDFINDATLNHLKLLIQIEENIPSIHLLFSIQLGLKNNIHVAYLQTIYTQYFYYFLNTDEQDLFLNQLSIDVEEKIFKIKEMITNEEQKQQAYYLLKKNDPSEVSQIDIKLKILDFQYQILISVDGTLSKQLINNWILQCSQKAIDGYQKIFPSKKQVAHPLVSLMYLFQSESYQFMNYLSLSQKMIDQAEITFKNWFENRKHPLKALFFYYQGKYKQWLYKRYLDCVEDVIELKYFDVVEIKAIIQGLINTDPQLYKIFDYYKQNVIKQITTHLENYTHSTLGKHKRQNIYQKYKIEDSKLILDDIISFSSIKELNGISQFMDSQSIFNHFGLDNQYTDKIRSFMMLLNQ